MLIEIKEPGQSAEKGKRDSVAVGIDLGTTNSVVAFAEDGEVQAIESAEGSELIPSIVAYSGDKVVVGDAARKSIVDKEENVIRSIKRLMGKGADDLADIQESLPYKLEKKSENNVPVVNVGSKKVTAVEVSAEILKKLKSTAEKKLKKKVTQAVITVPAYFDDAARVATKDAAKLAGLEVLRLINEPTAAALAYGLDNAVEGIYAVYDLGGGTFDISILKMEKGVFRVLSTAGDTALGGDDFDNEIVKYLCEKSGKKYPEDSVELNALLEAARKIKENLSSKNEVDITKETFEGLIKTYIQRTINICRQAVSDAKIDGDVKGVVLVGGSTRIPLVRKMVKEFFGKEPLANIDCDKVVAYGAAIQAENLSRGSGTLLMDVTPLSLGLETYGGLVEKIIERNTPIPAAKSQEFTTYQDGQTAMKIHVLQGEREKVDQCRSLAHFNLTGIPPMKAGLAKIKVSFTVDADGLLTVSAKELSTGKEQQVAVKPSYGLPHEKIEEMLRESFKNAKQDIIERLLMDARIEAEIMIKYIRDAVESDGDLLDDDERRVIEGALHELEHVKNTGNRDEIDYKVHELDKICSGFAEKRVNRALKKALAGQKI